MSRSLDELQRLKLILNEQMASLMVLNKEASSVSNADLQKQLEYANNNVADLFMQLKTLESSMKPHENDSVNFSLSIFNF